MTPSSKSFKIFPIFLLVKFHMTKWSYTTPKIYSKMYLTSCANTRASRANNSKVFRIKKTNFPRYCFYMNGNILGDFQICIIVCTFKLWNGLRRKKLNIWRMETNFFEIKTILNFTSKTTFSEGIIF